MEPTATRRFVGARGLRAFHDAISTTLVDQRLEPASADRFAAQLDAVEVGGVGLVDSRVSPLRARRESAGDAEGSIFLLTATTADGEIEHRRGAEVVRPDRVVVIPGGELFEVRYRFAAHVSFVVIPERIARRRFADLDGPIRSRTLAPTGRALVAQLAAIKRSTRALRATAIGGDGVLDRLATIVLDALADELRPSGSGGPTATRTAAERLIESHLRDPRLGVGMLAARLGVSRRTLHRAFEGGDSGVAGRIRDRRLDEAAKRLAEVPATPIGDVAAEFGFGSASAFAALFRERFGRSPAEHRSS